MEGTGKRTIVHMNRLGKVAKNVRVEHVETIPPHYFLRPSVIAAVRKEVKKDLNNGLRRTPGGVRVDWVDPGPYRLAWDYLKQIITFVKGKIWRKNTK